MAGGFRRVWSPQDTPPQGCDHLWHQYRPRLEAAAWTEGRGVELISVTAAKRPRRQRNAVGLVPRWGAEERGRGGKGMAAISRVTQEPQAGRHPCPLLGHWVKPFGHPGDSRAGLLGGLGVRGSAGWCRGRALGGGPLSPGTTTLGIL